MNRKEDFSHKIFTMLVFISLVVGLLAAAMFPFRNRDLKFVFHTAEQEYSFVMTHGEMKQNPIIEFVIDSGGEEIGLDTLQIYSCGGWLKVAHDNFEQLYPCIGNVEQVRISHGDKMVYVTPGEDGQIHLCMNEAFGEFCEKTSETRLQERLLCYGLYMCLVALICLLFEAVRERKSGRQGGNHNPLYEVGRFFKDMKNYYQFMVYAAKADLKAEVANSYLNRLWWLLEPFFSMMVYVIVFGNIMGSSVENYATFVFSALLMWNLFGKTLNYSVKLVRNNKDIVTKVYVPKFVLLFSNMILNLYKLAFSAIVLFAMMIVFQVHIGIHVFWVIPAYGVMILFSFGIGMILLHYGVYIDDLAYAVGILLNMVMFLSGIFYNIMTGLSSPLNAIMLCLNPVAMCIDTMRNALLYNSVENLPILAVWGVASILLCWIGVHIVYKNENSYVKIV